MLNWRTITPAHDPRFLTKGTELSFAIVPLTAHRFGISEVRSYTREGNALECDRIYCVRDAAAVNDADVRAGMRPPIVGRFASEDEALAFCERLMLDYFQNEPV